MQERKCNMRVLSGYAHSHNIERQTDKQPCENKNKQTKTDNLIEEKLSSLHKISIHLTLEESWLVKIN